MKNHTKVFLKSRNLTMYEVILCEVCGSPAVDVHHIINRGMGGSKLLDVPSNLIALCRECHDRAHSDRQFNQSLSETTKKYNKGFDVP